MKFSTWKIAIAVWAICIGHCSAGSGELINDLRLTPLQQVGLSQIIVTGKVTALEPELIKLPLTPGGDEVTYMVGVIKVEKVLQGAMRCTHLRVGFIPSRGAEEEEDEDFGIECRGIDPPMNSALREGQEGCFFLNKHHEGDVYVSPLYGSPLLKNSRCFEFDMEQIQKAIKVYENPLGVLKAKSSLDRQFAACLLVHKYLPDPVQRSEVERIKTEKISAEESRLILEAISEMLWGDVPFDRFSRFSLSPMFGKLALSGKEGWQNPAVKEGENYNFVMGDAVKKWLKENQSKYRIERRTFIYKKKGK